jgi:type II secretory pathway predicted ATPase ExeA
MNKKLLSLFGLKWNPFSPDVPAEALLPTAKLESFAFRVEQGVLREGGFALVTGDAGTGKSVALRLLAERLSRVPEVSVASISRPQANLADFYREIGELFGLTLKPHNRWHGAKALRERWEAHIETTLARPALLIDEAQEMNAVVLSELRLLSSTKFDSRTLLSVVLAGDGRLVEKLQREELLPLASRMRTRLVLDVATSEELVACLKHVMAAAGNAALMTKDLMAALADHALGNHRSLMIMAAELLTTAAQRELSQLDEKLFLDVIGAPRKAAAAPARAGRRA